MPSREEQTLLQFRGWTGGLSRDINEILLGQEDVAECLNIDFGISGKIVKRKGFTQKSTSDPAAMSWGTNLYHFRDSSSNDWLLYVDTDRELYSVKISAGTVLARAQLAGPIDIRVDSDNTAGAFNFKFYITGTFNDAKPYRFDGTTWIEMTDTDLDGSGTEFPGAATLVNTHERFFAFHTFSGGGFNAQ